MLVNMLARLEQIVDRVEIAAPGGVALQPNVIPLSVQAGNLTDALIEAGTSIGVVRVVGRSGGGNNGMTILVGPGPAVPGCLRIHGDGWVGACSTSAIDAGRPDSTLPIGPYIAATLGASEAFRRVRGAEARYEPINSFAYSAYSHRTGAGWFADGPANIDGACISTSLAGAGAVGTAWLHTIWAADQVNADIVAADPDTVDESNLNRCVLFVIADIDRDKANVVESVLERGGLTITARTARIEQVPDRPEGLVVAADTNRARASIQSTRPFPLMFASTFDLRAEVVRCDPRSDGPCMRCYNQPEPEVPDEELAARFLTLPDDARRELSEKVGTGLDAAEQWAADPTCGTAGSRVLDALREADSDDAALFSVPFVSVFAGVVLAAESLKRAVGTLDAPLNEGMPRAVFQFLRPAAPTNGAGAYRRDPSCPHCDPDTPSGQAWHRAAAGQD